MSRGLHLSAPQLARCLTDGLWEALRNPAYASQDAYALLHNAGLVRGGDQTELGRATWEYPDKIVGLLAANPSLRRQLLSASLGEPPKPAHARSTSVLVLAGLVIGHGLTPLGRECQRRLESRFGIESPDTNPDAERRHARRFAREATDA